MDLIEIGRYMETLLKLHTTKTFFPTFYTVKGQNKEEG